MTIQEKITFLADYLSELDKKLDFKTKNYIIHVSEQGFREAVNDIHNGPPVSPLAVNEKPTLLNEGTIQMGRKGINFYIQKTYEIESNQSIAALGKPHVPGSQAH